MKPVFLTGYMGSGKTTVGKLLAEALQYQFIDLDKYIEQKQERTIADIFALNGETVFREIERNCLHEVAKFQNTIISTGGGAPCFFDNMEFINKNGISVYLKLSVSQLAERLSEDNDGTRPLIASLIDTELENHIAEQLKKREPFYNLSGIIIENDESAKTVIEIEKILKLQH